MTYKNLLKRLLVIIGVGGIVAFVIIFFFLTFYLPGNVYSYYPNQARKIFGIPVRLEIPEINVDAKITEVGASKDGSMETPTGRKDVGWFMFGPRPGEIGSAVIDGHYGVWKNGEGGVFNDINKLKKGDKVYVEDENGTIIIFSVRKILTYDLNDSALPVFSSSDGKSHLNLITCEGIWDNVNKTYSNRLVVFTDRE
jgi:LPXTG-site transpeptidase (sortase) family protein